MDQLSNQLLAARRRTVWYKVVGALDAGCRRQRLVRRGFVGAEIKSNKSFKKKGIDLLRGNKTPKNLTIDNPFFDNGQWTMDNINTATA